jgi:hypothetical protein
LNLKGAEKKQGQLQLFELNPKDVPNLLAESILRLYLYR